MTNNHGGPRTGAGRPAKHGVRKVRFDARVTPDVREFLKSREQSAGEFLEAMIRRRSDFKQWQSESKVTAVTTINWRNYLATITAGVTNQ